MTTKFLIYETVVPLTFATHRDSSVEIGKSFAFSSKINSVPLTAIEFREELSDYPTVFAGNQDAAMPAVILGLREGENLYLFRRRQVGCPLHPGLRPSLSVGVREE
jgi:SapC